MVVPLDQVDAQAVFLRLLTNIILGMAVRLEGAKKPKKNVLLVLDEFVRLGRMEKLINIANVAAGWGIEALFITQDKDQIESVYGKGDTASILGSCVTTRIFGLAVPNSKPRIGPRMHLAIRRCSPHEAIVCEVRGEPQDLNRRAAPEAHDRRSAPGNEDRKMLLLTGSKPPALIDAIVSHRHPAYRGKLDRNPMV